ncbi:MAG: MmgE/PrpD family protein [Burkholderiales bacterium]|nr:MmgE/PrpD family protein [Burkholderiales bacterium]
MQTATTALAELIVRTRFEDLPSEVVWEAKRRIADVVGAGLAGSRTSIGTRITEFATGMGKSGDCVIWGSGQRSSPAYAALANGTMTFHLELDDVHRTSNTHPGVTTIPAALALAEARGLSGRDLLASVVLGYEAQIRVGLAVSPSIFVDRTFLPPGTQGVFGAAAAAAKLLGLDAEATAGALGAASYIGPLAPFESFRLGAPSKDTIMGWANHSGLHAAELAARGFGGPGSALEGEYGFCRTVSQRFDMDRLFRGLGQSFEILRTGIKPYACCRQHHTAIDAVMELKELHGLRPEQVERIRHRTFIVGSRGSDTRPQSVQAAKYSAPYTIAVALALGRNERAQYAMDLIGDASLLHLASMVEVSADVELEALYNEKWPSIIEVTLKDGRVLTARRDLPKGEPEHPVSDAELKEKFLSLASDCVSADRAKAIWEAIFTLDEAADVSALTRLLMA